MADIRAVDERPCNWCGAEAPAFIHDPRGTAICEDCKNTTPKMYQLALLSMGAAPEWLALSPDRREAHQQVLALLKDLNRVARVLIDPDLPNDSRGVAEGVRFVSLLTRAVRYKAKGDPQGQLQTESSFRGMAVVFVEACAKAKAKMTTESALMLLRITYPRFPVNEDEFGEIVHELRDGKLRRGKWERLAELVGWTGDAETLRLHHAAWRKTKLGRNLVDAAKG